MRCSPTQTKVSSKVSETVQVRYLSRNATGREFQRHSRATEELTIFSQDIADITLHIVQ